MIRVGVTGANGFIGQALIARLADDLQFQPVGLVRSNAAHERNGVEYRPVGDIGLCGDAASALEGVECVVHTAARVHVLRDRSADPMAEFRRVNVEGTLHLARGAALAGAKRFVFLSSVKVNGESTEKRCPFSEKDVPAPEDPYGISKLEAECRLRDLGEATGMEVVIVRPPLVYGPGVKGNLGTLIRWVAAGWPLPLGGIDRNRRSLVGLDNLVDFIVRCVEQSAAANQTFLVSDGEDVSTASLVRKLAAAMGRSARLVTVPEAILRGGAKVVGRDSVCQRLCGSLEVDISHGRRLLCWKPAVSMDEGLRRAVED